MESSRRTFSWRVCGILSARLEDEAFHALNDSIRTWYTTHDLLEVAEKDAEKRPGAYIAMVSKARREVWILGDCQALVDGILYTETKAIDSLMELNRAMLIEEALIQGHSHDYLLHHPEIIQDRLAEFMTHQASFQNRMVGTSTFGYPVLDGFFDHFESIIVVQLGKGPKKSFLPDGYPFLHPDARRERDEAQASVSKDPLCIRISTTKGLNPAYSSFDDRSYLRIRIDDSLSYERWCRAKSS